MPWTESPYSRDTIERFARAGALIRIVGQENACSTCQSYLNRVYAPDQAPRLPISNCTSAYCRCRFEAVDSVSKLPVSELVNRGAQLAKAKMQRGAVAALRRAIALDELYEPAWLWLSAVVDDAERAQCMEKVLSINPKNAWARKNLALLRNKLNASLPATGTRPFLVDLPLDVLQVRAERQVIVEQWQAFMRVIPQIAPKIACDQAMAFLRSLDRANGRAVEQLFTIPALRDEMEQQWRELDVVGRSLGQAIRDFASRTDHPADKLAMNGIFQLLFNELLSRRKEMKKQVLLYGGQVE